MVDNKENEEVVTNPDGEKKETVVTNSDEENKEEVSEKTVKTKVIIVQEDALIKPTDSGVEIRITYDFIREYLDKYKDYSDKQIKGILSQCSQDDLHEVFAAGIKALVEEKIVKVLEEAEEKYTKEEIRKAEAAQKAKEDKDKRRWFVIPVVLFLGVATFITKCGGDHKDPNPIVSEQTPEDKEEEKVDDDLPDTVTQVKSDTFTIYKPDDSTQFEKAVTDYGNQESASNDRKEGTISDGQDEWDRENEAMENYDKNQENIEALEECLEILKCDTATIEEKKEALRKMTDPSLEVKDSFDSNQMEDMVQEAIKQSQENPDGITDQEIQVALEMQEEYETQKRCQESNVRVLMYLHYLEENGYEIGDIEVEENERGDLTIFIISNRTVDKSEANTESKSFDEYSEALDEFLGANPDHDIRDFNSYLKGEEKNTPESPKLNTTKSNEYTDEEKIESESSELNTSESAVFTDEDYEAMLEKSDPEKVKKATDKLIDAMKNKEKFYTTTELGEKDMSLTITPKNPTNREGDLYR